MTVIAMVPARMGSERLKMKNLALMNGRPLISYAIEAARASGVFTRVVLNSDGDIFGEIARRYGVQFYLRPPHLGSSVTKSDDVVYDFMLKYPCEAVAWVNPISPLQTAYELREVVTYFFDQGLDEVEGKERTGVRRALARLYRRSDDLELAREQLVVLLAENPTDRRARKNVAQPDGPDPEGPGPQWAARPKLPEVLP